MEMTVVGLQTYQHCDSLDALLQDCMLCKIMWKQSNESKNCNLDWKGGRKNASENGWLECECASLSLDWCK